MAIFKVITSPEGKSVGKATPQKLEDYLKYEENEQREKLPRDATVSALNASAENFSEDCEWVRKKHGIKRDYASLKYQHYVQGFPPEDCGKMTREKCHALGVEAAKTFWGDFPVLVVTHYDQEVEGTGEYHWHNHFLVYNCNVHTGRRIKTCHAELWAQKRFIAAQADAEGLTRKGLILENGRIRKSDKEVKENMAERWVRKHGQAASGRDIFLTQKTELRLAIVAARRNTSNYDEFCKYLYDVYGIRTKESREAIGYLHPDRSSQNRAWIRGDSLGKAFTKEAIINGFNEQNNRAELIDRSGKIAYYERLYRAILCHYSSVEGNFIITGHVSPAEQLGINTARGGTAAGRAAAAGDSGAEGLTIRTDTEGRGADKTPGSHGGENGKSTAQSSERNRGSGGTHI